MKINSFISNVKFLAPSVVKMGTSSTSTSTNTNSDPIYNGGVKGGTVRRRTLNKKA